MFGGLLTDIQGLFFIFGKPANETYVLVHGAALE
jgi:hypothetical protein